MTAPGPSLLALLILASGAAESQQLSYSRSFPGSTPDFFRIVIEHDGSLEYSEAVADPKPVRAHLSASDAAPLFDMAAKLNYFKTPIESGLKVANTGKKVFRFQGADGAVSETTFNYSTNEIAQKLLERFEQIGESERAYLDLDRCVHFDKLGVNDALAEIEGLWLKKQLADPDQFIPLLTRVATHESFMHLARDRAARLKDAFSKSASPNGGDGPAAPAAADSKQASAAPHP